MRAIVLNAYGEPSVLELADVPEPSAGPGQIEVAVAATALNRADLLQRRGLYPGPATDHEIPGLEFSGVVTGLGPGTSLWNIGDRVMGIVEGGAYAEKVVLHERQALAIPDDISTTDAAALPEVFMTAFDALVVQGGLTSGRWALVHAGGSGVGTASIQIVKAIGARIAVTASAGKLDRCRQLGCDLAIDYGSQDFVEELTVATNGEGVDVVLDVIGGEYTVNNLKALKTKGRLIQVGVMGKQTVELPLGMLLPKRASIIGTVLRARPIEEKISLTRRVQTELLPLFDQKRLAPVIDSVYRIADIVDAHTYMETNQNFGKIIIQVDKGFD